MPVWASLDWLQTDLIHFEDTSMQSRQNLSFSNENEMNSLTANSIRFISQLRYYFHHVIFTVGIDSFRRTSIRL